MCEVNPAPILHDPEDGMTDELGRILAAEGEPHEGLTWEKIWRLLFPDDPDVLSSGKARQSPALSPKLTHLPDFDPVVELAEIDHIFDEGQEALKANLREKLRLLLPSTIDDPYCCFVTGQLDLIFETHRADMMRKALSLGGAPASGEPLSGNQTAETPGPPRRPNRRSRRSTLLQGIYSATAHRQMQASNANHAGRPRSEVSRYAAEMAPRNPPSPQAQRLSPVPDHLVHSPERTAAAPAPRELRDSGIGMPCDACECELAQCKCSSTPPISHADGNGGDGRKEPFLLGITSSGRTAAVSAAATAEQRRPLACLPLYQPRLRVQTEGLGKFPEECGTGSCVGSGGGAGFSPQSFKQRLLRQQLMGG